MAQNLEIETSSYNLPYEIQSISLSDLLIAFVVASDEGAKETTSIEVADLLSQKKKDLNKKKILKIQADLSLKEVSVFDRDQDEVPYLQSQAEKLSSVESSEVGFNLKFLIESHLIYSIEPGQYKPTEGTVRFARALNWDEDNAKYILRQTISKTWYTYLIAKIFYLSPLVTYQDLFQAFAKEISIINIDASIIKSNASLFNRSHKPEYQIKFLIDFLEYLNYFTKINEAEITSTIAPELLAEFKMTESLFPTLSTSDTKNPPIAVSVTFNINNWDDLTEANALRLHEWLKLVAYGKP